MNPSASGYGKRNTQMGCVCKTIEGDCAYACAQHLVRIK